MKEEIEANFNEKQMTAKQEIQDTGIILN